MLFTYLLSLYRVVGIVLCICQLSLLIGIFIYSKDRLPEAIWLQTCSVNVVLLVMCIPVFIVTSADIRCYLLIYCLRLVNL